MRRKIVAGNWKMNKSLGEAKELIGALNAAIDNANENQPKVIVFPPFPYLHEAVNTFEGKVEVGAQNVSNLPSGAYTGEVSAEMIKSVGAGYALVGHSERREYFHEESAILQGKIAQALSYGLEVVFCCGESLEEREDEKHFEVVTEQIVDVLENFTDRDMVHIAIAYEPVWAIGTGKTASTEQAQEMHAHIRNMLREHFNETVANHTPILYGGSCKPANAGELFKQPDIDGGLIGGASLSAEDFLAIVNA